MGIGLTFEECVDLRLRIPAGPAPGPSARRMPAPTHGWFAPPQVYIAANRLSRYNSALYFPILPPVKDD